MENLAGVNKNTKNEELEKLFAEQLASGLPFCFYRHLAVDENGKPKVDEQDNQYYSLFIAQKKDNPTATPSLDAMLLGWESSRTFRSVKRITRQIFEKGNPMISGLAQIGKLHSKLTNEEVFALIKSGTEEDKKKIESSAITTIQTIHSLEKPYENKEPRKTMIKNEWFLVCDLQGNLMYETNELVLKGAEKDMLIKDIQLIKESEYQMSNEPATI